MENSCPKCGSLRLDSDAQCGGCGIVYAKLGGKATLPAASVTSSGHRLQWWLILLCILLAVAAIFPRLHAAATSPNSRPAGKDPAPITEGPNQTQSDEDKADTARIETAKIAGRIMGQYQQWKDSVAVARSIDRNALSASVANLQTIRRSVLTIDAPACLGPAKQSLLDSMNREIDGFLVLLRNDATATDAAASPYFDEAQSAADVYEKRIHECVAAATA